MQNEMPIPIAVVDTCFLLRFLTGDPPEQAERAEQAILEAIDGRIVLRVPALVVAELIWTLESSIYNLSRAAAAEKAVAILHSPGMEVDDAALLEGAARLHAEKCIDFTDAFIVTYAKVHDITDVCTFDRRDFRKFDYINILPTA